MREKSHAIHCSIEQCDLMNDNGNYVPGVEATCPKCGHVTQSFGTGERSVKRCLVLMREECPNGERNFYVANDDNDVYESAAPAPPTPIDSQHDEGNGEMDDDQYDIPF